MDLELPLVYWPILFLNEQSQVRIFPFLFQNLCATCVMQNTFNSCLEIWCRATTLFITVTENAHCALINICDCESRFSLCYSQTFYDQWNKNEMAQCQIWR